MPVTYSQERLREDGGNVEHLLETLTAKLAGIHEAIDNQATASNLRMDKLIDAANEPYFKIIVQSLVDQTVASGKKLDRLVALSESLALARKTEMALRRTAGPGAIDQDQPVERPTLPQKKAEGATGAKVPPNALDHYQPILDTMEKWHGPVPRGFIVDFLGVITDGKFREQFGVNPAKVGGKSVKTTLPKFVNNNAEWWFEAVNWFEAAREARDRYVMITLGACYGAQAVGAQRALDMVNPMPSKLVAVEPEPENFEWLQQHFRDNGIDPDEHWLINAAISDRNEPVLFPVGAAGSGANNCFATNEASERLAFAERLIADGEAPNVLKRLMESNTTGVVKELLPDRKATGEIKYVSSVTLRDVLAPFDFVDYVEADMQQSEIVVFPPFIDLLRRKVRRIHLGTHGTEVHKALHDMFEANGWDIIFSYGPDAVHDSALGKFVTNDGVLTVRNPDF
jgi:FkbM family methyltransferase